MVWILYRKTRLLFARRTTALNGANFALNSNDIELLLTIAKDEGLKVLFFAKDSNNNLYVGVKCNEYIKIK